MSTGTYIIESALSEVGAHSIVAAADPSDIAKGRNKLNSMIQLWLDKGIDIGATPLDKVGDELNEVASATNCIIFNLALELAGPFSGGGAVVSPELRVRAGNSLSDIEAIYGNTPIPKKKLSSTMPLGGGDRGRFENRNNFAGKDYEVDG